MPELPEVETTKEGIKSQLEGHLITDIKVRNYQLRMPIPHDIAALCKGKKIKAVTRRAKYILLHLSNGYIAIHLGMSGHLRIVPINTSPEKHDHLDLLLDNGFVLRYCDPRRFGLFMYIDDNPQQHSIFSKLGPEPLEDDFNGEYLSQRAKKRAVPIKSFIMNNDIVVGVGNIYATESLFNAGIHPLSPANTISQEILNVLAVEIKNVLQLAIKAGGTTLRDFYSFDGKPGYFRISLKAYGRKGQPCIHCTTPIETVIIGGRNSAFCPRCQLLSCSSNYT